MTERVYNFSPGPAVLPLPVLEQAQRDLLALPGLGISVLEISHRSKAFDEILHCAESNLRQLLTIPDNFRVLFLQGGARLQFSMAPMNLLAGGVADYIITGSWGKKAFEEAKREGKIHVAFDGRESNYSVLPTSDELLLTDEAAFVHFTSNETIQGVQFQQEPEVGDRPLVCDASSDILSRPLEMSRYGLIYACAQKNAGPAGVTVVVIRDDLLARSPGDLPGMLNYRNHVEAGSCYNTPPVFGVYLIKLITDWLFELGGLSEIQRRNEEKSKLLYDQIDQSDGFYLPHAARNCRSRMNVTFRLSDESLQSKFLAGAAARGLVELKGHRSVGGVRASIYNAMPLAGVERLAEFMKDFRQQKVYS